MRRHDHTWAWRRIWWPGSLTPDAALTVMDRLAADPHLGAVAWETRSTNGNLKHLVAVHPGHGRALNHMLATLVPGMRIDASKAQRSRHPLIAGRLGVSHPSLALGVDRITSVSRSTLAALAATGKGESLVLQVILGGRIRPATVPHRAPDPHESWFDLLQRGSRPAAAETRTSMRTRASAHGFHATIRIGAHAATKERARELTLGVLGALRVAEASGVHLTFTPEDPAKLAYAVQPWRWPLHLSAREATGLMGWPIGVDSDVELPGMPAKHPQPLPLIREPKSESRPFVLTTAPGQDIRVGIGATDSLQHTVLLGPTASGKSTAMLTMIMDAIHSGRSALVIDPKTDLINEVLARIPKHRRGDVVVIDPTDSHPVGLNPLSAAGRSSQVVADSILAVFKELFSDSWGPRTQDILTAALLTLASHPGATLTMLPALLTDDTFRRRLIRGNEDRIGLGSFWTSYEAMSVEQRAQAIAPVMNKLRQFLLRPSIRTVIGQADPLFNLADLFTKRRIVLVSLNKGLIGSEGARLLGALVVSQLWPLILGRAAMPAAQRHPVGVFIDEVQDYLALPTDLEDALSQARGLGVGLTLAHQYRRQLPTSLRAGIDTNARNKVIFGLNADDAADLARQAPGLESRDFQLLPRFHVYLNLIADGHATGWFSGKTLPPSPTTTDPVELRAASARAYGREAATVDQEVLEAIGLQDPTAASDEAIGRRKSTGGQR